MSKQKSGLGRGLNALFDDSSVSHENNRPKEEAAPVKQAEPVQATEPAPAQVIPAQPAARVDTTPAPAEAVAQPAQTEEKQAANIYFSEDAVENAKVVEREVRKTPTPRTTPRQKKSTAAIFEEQQNVAKQEKKAQQVHKAVKEEDKEGAIKEVPLQSVEPNPDQPRTNFKPEEIEELAQSIKTEGLLQPILVRKVGDKYQIIAGERRWQACRSLGMETISVRFWSADNDKALELALVENIQRTDLNPIEEAYGYKRLMERKGMTQSEVAQTVSKGRSTIANALRLLDLPEEAQQLLFEEKITAGHARAILSIPSPEGRKQLTDKLVHEKLSVRETEALARLYSGREKAKENSIKRIPAPASFKKAARSLSRLLQAPVRVKTVQGKNKIEIQFKDEEELERIFNAISHVEETAENTKTVESA